MRDGLVSGGGDYYHIMIPRRDPTAAIERVEEVIHVLTRWQLPPLTLHEFWSTSIMSPPMFTIRLLVFGT